MINIELLIEKYLGRVPGMGGYYKKTTAEIFINPSQKEMREAASNKRLRFIAYAPKKELYVWCYDGSLHSDVWDTYIKNDCEDYLGDIKAIWGIIKFIGGNWIMTRSDVLDMLGSHKNYNPKNYSWLDKYHIDVNKYMLDAEWRKENSKWE